MEKYLIKILDIEGVLVKSEQVKCASFSEVTRQANKLMEELRIGGVIGEDEHRFEITTIPTLPLR
jgi:hypothetical protein